VVRWRAGDNFCCGCCVVVVDRLSDGIAVVIINKCIEYEQTRVIKRHQRCQCCAAACTTRGAATTAVAIESSRVFCVRCRGASRSIYAPLDTAPPAGDAVTAVNVAFDVFLTEAQVRHATVLMRQKLAECTALRIREAAADARAAAESALHEQASE
jgi:hypothetical protein